MNSDKDLIAAISRLSRIVRRHPKDHEHLSYTGHHVLHLIMEHNGIRTTELAELEGVRPSSITDALNRLEKNGFVVREKDQTDSRVKRVYITDKTREHMERKSQAKQKKNAQMLACLTEEESTAFLSICNKLCEFLESEESKGGNHE